MKARQSKWDMVRLRRTTHAALRRLGANWLIAYGRGLTVPEPDERDGIGVDRIVRELLARDDAHRARADRQRRRRKAAPRQDRTTGSDSQVNGQHAVLD